MVPTQIVHADLGTWPDLIQARAPRKRGCGSEDEVLHELSAIRKQSRNGVRGSDGRSCEQVVGHSELTPNEWANRKLALPPPRAPHPLRRSRPGHLDHRRTRRIIPVLGSRLPQRCHLDAYQSEGPAVAVCPFGVGFTLRHEGRLARFLRPGWGRGTTALLLRGALFALRMLLRSSTRRRCFCIFPLRCHPERGCPLADEGPAVAFNLVLSSRSASQQGTCCCRLPFWSAVYPACPGRTGAGRTQRDFW
jgi:hypothetical protein